MTLLVLLSCTGADSPKETASPWDPDSTLCGTAAGGACDSAPTEVEIWSLSEGLEPCDEGFDDTGEGGATGWRDELVATLAVEDGTFQGSLEPGTYAAISYWGDCWDCEVVEVVEDGCASVALQGKEVVYADAPNVYLYPEAPAELAVRVAAPHRITAADPPYPPGGWLVGARPDGALRTPQGARDYLFYERTIDLDRFQREAGWCIDGPQAQVSIETEMAALGFLDAEIADFTAFWEPIFPRAWALTVYPQVRGLPALRIDPEPDSLLRAWFLVEEGCADPAPFTEAVPAREGFHAAEWGVILAAPLPHEAGLGWAY